MRRMLAGLLGLTVAMSAARAADTLPPVIKLGVLSDMSGAYKENSGPGGIVAARLAIEDFGGSVMGHRVEVVGGDDQNKPDVASTVARQWLDRDGVAAIFDGGNSVTALAILTIAKEHDRAFLMDGPASLTFTNESCSPVSLQFAYDAYGLAKAMVKPLVDRGDNTWFFITADYAGGISLENGMAEFVRSSGGTIVGGVRHPFPNSDFSSFLLQAQASKAKVIATANGGDDSVNTIKQAAEFGIGPASGQSIAVSTLYLNAIKSLGLQTAQGLVTATPFYWDTDDASRSFAARYRAEKGGTAPEMNQAAMYSAVMHYLKAVRDVGAIDGSRVVARMKQVPVNDFWNHDVAIRADGRVLNEMRLMQVKTPDESRGPYDYMKQLAVVPGAEAFQPLSASKCPLLAKPS